MNHQNDGHHHAPTADSLLTGYAIGIVGVFAFAFQARPVRARLIEGP